MLARAVNGSDRNPNYTKLAYDLFGSCQFWNSGELALMPAEIDQVLFDAMLLGAVVSG